MWLNMLWRRWFGRTRPFPSHLRRQRPARRSGFGPRLEVLEERTLLSAPGDVSLGNVNVPSSSQGGQVSGTYFLGGSFNTGNQTVGGITGSDPFAFGAQLNLNLSGKVGVDLGYSASSGGQVSATYQGVKLQQNYVEPTQFNQDVNFTSQNTNVSYADGSFKTSGPSVSASAALDANINGSIGGTVAFFNSYSNSVNFSTSVHQQLFNIGLGSTSSNDLGLSLSVLGQDLTSYLNTYSQIPALSLSVNPAGPEVPVFIEGDLSGSTSPFSLHQDLQLGVGEGEGDEEVGGAKELGSVDEFAPDISLKSTSLQSGGTLTDSGQGKIADLKIQMGSLLGGILTDADTFSIGPAHVTFTPVSFELGPDLVLAQSGTVAPTNKLTYQFSSAVDVTENGADLGKVSSVTFTPGVDNIGIQFTGTPITVTPTWNFGLDYTNELDLDVNLEGELKAGEASVGFGPANSPSIGPLYTQSFDFADYKVATLYDNTYTIYSSSHALSPFTIGDTFKPSLVVNTTADGNTPYNPANPAGTGSLRAAVESANTLNTSSPQIIQVGPGTYDLQSLYGGALSVTAQNVIIEGAGAGQTIINASGLGDRVFSVAPGANLTLEGVTVTGGSGVADGGGILNNGTLTIRNSAVSNNSSGNGGGGGIENFGTLTVSDSEIESNTTVNNGIGNLSLGGGIYNEGSATIVNSTIDNNLALDEGGGIYNVLGDLTVINSTISGNETASNGGGIANEGFSVTVINSTISANSCAGAGGGIYDPQFTPTSLQNTIVAGNFQGTSPDDISGPVDSNSAYNLIGDGAGMSGISNGSNGNQVGQPNALLDPRLAPLGNYGGPTQTMALLQGSAAIDAGSSSLAASAGLTTDQRGFGRDVGANVDIGAVEYQYDLDLSGYLAAGSAPGTVQYFYAVTNNGPDPVAGATLTVPLPTGVAFQSLTSPLGWKESDPGAGNNGTVTFTDTGSLNSGQSAGFTIAVQLQNTTVGAILTSTATVGPAAEDNNLQNNAVTLTVANEQEGQTFHNALLFHFLDPNPKATANDFSASVAWGVNDSNTSSDGTGTVSVVADPNGGFDVLGSHDYAEEGNYGIAVAVTGMDGTTFRSGNTLQVLFLGGPETLIFAPQQLFVVADAPLTAGALTPPPNATVNQPITNALLFHFTDADPNGTASDHTATVTWGDGTTNSSSDSSGNVSVVADLAGGFDVLGSHLYSQLVNPGTFRVQVSDAGGASTNASDSNFQVLYPDQPLTAGALNVPPVTTEGQSISSQVLFHFSDADTNAQASDYLATVTWGDGTFNSSDDNSGSVAVVANANGGFDVVGSHIYGEGSGNYFSVKVTDLGDSSSTQLDRGGQSTGAVSSTPLTITDPPVVVTAGQTFTANPNTLSSVQTIATFTDPGGPEPNATEPDLMPAPYLATIQWGDGTITVATLTTQVTYTQASVNSAGQVVGQLVSAKNVGGIVLGSDGQTFSVHLAHQYATVGSYTITTIILHDGLTSGPVTTQAAVADAVTATGGFSIASNAGISTGSQTVATFTDPGGAGPLSDYSASINWGDGTSSQPDITSGVISYSAATGVFTVSGAHAYANVGTYPITVVIENFNAFPVTVSSSASIVASPPTVTVRDDGGTYNGNSFPAIGKAVGIDGKTQVSGTFTYAYYVGTSTTGTSSATAPSDAGTYTVVATFSSSDPNYTGGTAQTSFTIAKAATALSILAGQNIIVGTATTTVSGKLTSDTIVPAGQSVAILLNGVKQSAQVGADGTFSASFTTSSLGVGQYSITYSYAGDGNFDAAAATGSLTVDYGTQLLFNNSKPVHSGACLPIKLALTGAGGTDISSASIAVTATSLVDANGNPVSLKCEGNSNPNDLFRYDPSLGGYIFNLDTKGLAAGSYTLYYKAGDDPVLHSFTFVVD